MAGVRKQPGVSGMQHIGAGRGSGRKREAVVMMLCRYDDGNGLATSA